MKEFKIKYNGEKILSESELWHIVMFLSRENADKVIEVANVVKNNNGEYSCQWYNKCNYFPCKSLKCYYDTLYDGYPKRGY